MSLFQKAKHICSKKNKIEKPFSRQIFIGLDSSIRDLVDFGGRKMGSTFSKIWNKLENKSVSLNKKILRRIVPRAVSNHVPFKFLSKIQICFFIIFRGQSFCGVKLRDLPVQSGSGPAGLQNRFNFSKSYFLNSGLWHAWKQ